LLALLVRCHWLAVAVLCVAGAVLLCRVHLLWLSFLRHLAVQ
jgi:hypothetical protein